MKSISSQDQQCGDYLKNLHASQILGFFTWVKQESFLFPVWIISQITFYHKENTKYILCKSLILFKNF